MFKIVNRLVYDGLRNKVTYKNCIKGFERTFLSQAYYCNEVWNHRLNDPLLHNLNLEEIYYELDQRFQKTRQVSAVDVDIFVNAVTDDSHNDEVLDIVHKLRLSADTGNTLESTSHAVIRALMQHGNRKDLLDALDDRLNYGLFLDYYTANLLFDIYWKCKDFMSGARVASQLMLQEEYNHPLSISFSLLHCYKFLLNPVGWPEYVKPEEPEEEVKIRVKFLRNPYFDDHFDLRDYKPIVGKTLAMFTKGKDDPLNKSLNILGLALYNKPQLFKESLKDCTSKNIKLYKEIINLIPEDSESKQELQGLNLESVNVEELLVANVEKAAQESSEMDIAKQCEVFSKWETDRKNALEEQKNRLLTAKRLSNIEDLKKAIKEKETRLWFFSNEEQIELDIQAKRIYYPKRWFGKKKTPKKVDEGYIPPDVQTKRSS